MAGNVQKLFLLLSIVRASVGLFPTFNNYTSDEHNRNKKSWEISSIMDTSADPCQNYYQFACGNWHTKFPATDHLPVTGGLFNAMHEFGDVFSEVLNGEILTDTESDTKLKNLYKSCINGSGKTLTEYRNSMKNLIKEFGTMPALAGKKWQQKKFDWVKIVGEISHKYGVHILYETLIDTSIDRKSNIFILKPKELVLKVSSGSAVKKYTLEIEKHLIKFLGIKKAIAKRTALNIANFEATILKTLEKASGLYLVTDGEHLHKQSSALQTFANVSFGYIPHGKMHVMKFDVISELENVVKKTPNATVANYIFYHLIRDFSENFMFNRNYKTCTAQIIKLFPMIVSKMTHRAYQLQASVSEFRSLYQDIVASMQTVLESDSLSWFDDENREFALEKIHGMKMFVDTFEEYDLDKEYESLEINAIDYMKNIKAIKSFKAKQLRSTLDMKPEILSSMMQYATPAYWGAGNVVMFTVPTLLTKFLMISMVPMALKYSRSGFVIGHEISHSFSGNARLYDRLGDYVGSVGDIEDEFDERINCLYDQYSNYKYPKGQSAQDKTQSENIADIAGVALAYHAYTRWLTSAERTEEELNMESLPNINLTNKQLFFIYYSQTWCADYSKTYLKLPQNDIHSIGPMRAVLPLVNFNEFAKAFNCPLGSAMNPTKKCSLS